MRISKKELDLIASTPKKECWICQDIIRHTKRLIFIKGFVVEEKYLKENTSIKEHLRQIIRR